MRSILYHMVSTASMVFDWYKNWVNRAAVLTAVSEHFPALSRWATWCYQRPTRLQFAEWVVESSAGVQQGDPLGPLLFAVAIQPLARDLCNAGLDIAVHYLDDGILAGDVAAVSRALRLVEARAATIGLTLNLAKCELVAAGSTDIAALHCHFPDSLLRDAEGSNKVQRDFELLGAAVGDAAFVRAHTAERATKAGNLLVGGPTGCLTASSRLRRVCSDAPQHALQPCHGANHGP